MDMYYYYSSQYVGQGVSTGAGASNGGEECQNRRGAQHTPEAEGIPEGGVSIGVEIESNVFK